MKHTILQFCLLFMLLTKTSAHAGNRDADIYYGFGTAEVIFIEGRIKEKRNGSEAAQDDSWHNNLWRKMRQLINDEKKNENAKVMLGNATYDVTTDDEGYFKLYTRTPSGLKQGWNSLQVILKDQTQIDGEFLLIPNENEFGIISDFDDTVIHSDVLNKTNLLANSLLKNFKQRSVVQDMPKLFNQLVKRNPHPQSTPVFIVSASPKQISRGINQFIAYNKFPKSLVMTKTITGNAKDPIFDQKQYKIDKIEQIFTRLPNVKFVLIGDDGEKDPESFYELQNNYPDRIISVWIHNVNTDANRVKYPQQQGFIDGHTPLSLLENI